MIREFKEIPAEKRIANLVGSLEKRIGKEKLAEFLFQASYHLEMTPGFTVENLFVALKREGRIVESRSWKSSNKGGRPAQIELYIQEYNSLVERGEEDQAYELLNAAKGELSRTSFWRLRKKLGLVE